MIDAPRKCAWDESYQRQENYVFHPCDEVVRFVSKYLRKRIDLDTVVDVSAGAQGSRVLDVGAGLGRNLVFGNFMGLEMYGIELSEVAVVGAKEWVSRGFGAEAAERVLQGDVQALPWPMDFFDHALSDSVLDSMPYSTARAGVAELARVLRRNGLFYCNFISGERGEGAERFEFDGEEVVTAQHERNTIQSYFGREKIYALLSQQFDILRCELHRIEDVVSGASSGRWHVVARKR